MQVTPRVFISYHRADSEADAGRLEDTLKHKLGSDHIFTDVSDIEIGADWERAVAQTLDGAVALLLVAGPAWMLTAAIAFELRSALEAEISIIPVLVRRANWPALTETLPAGLQTLQKLNAVVLDHRTWQVDVAPLLSLLERMLADPTRARIICRPPDPVALLSRHLNRGSIRSLLIHAADLAECLGDPSVLVEAQGARTPAPFRKHPWEPEARSELIGILGDARSRLMTEQVAREVAHLGEYAARLLGDSSLEEDIRRKRKDFEDARRECYRNRGEGADDLPWYQEQSAQASAVATNRLLAQLPGLTKDAATRDRLFRLIEGEVRDILTRESVADEWEYVILKHFAATADKRYEVRDADRQRVSAMLQAFASKPRAW